MMVVGWWCVSGGASGRGVGGGRWCLCKVVVGMSCNEGERLLLLLLLLWIDPSIPQLAG